MLTYADVFRRMPFKGAVREASGALKRACTSKKKNCKKIKVLLERLRAHSREHALLKEEQEEYRLAKMEMETETEEDKFDESRYDAEL